MENASIFLMILTVVVCYCLFFSSVATGVLMYQKTSSSNITGPDKITVSGDPTNPENSKEFVSMKNGDATLVMQNDGNLVSRLKDTIIWQTGTKTAGSKAFITYKGLFVIKGDENYWTSTLVKDDIISTNPTLFLKTNGHLEFWSSGSLIWSSK